MNRMPYSCPRSSYSTCRVRGDRGVRDSRVGAGVGDVSVMWWAEGVLAVMLGARWRRAVPVYEGGGGGGGGGRGGGGEGGGGVGCIKSYDQGHRVHPQALEQFFCCFCWRAL